MKLSENLNQVPKLPPSPELYKYGLSQKWDVAYATSVAPRWQVFFWWWELKMYFRLQFCHNIEFSLKSSELNLADGKSILDYDWTF